MESERSPLGSSSFPRYTFLGGGGPSKPKFPRLCCCIWTSLIVFLVVISGILLLYFLNPSQSSKTISRTSLDGLLRLRLPLQDESYADTPQVSENELEALETGVESLRGKDILEETRLSLAVESPAFRHQLATPTTSRAREMSRRGFIMNVASKEMKKRYSNTTNGARRRWAIIKYAERYPREEYCGQVELNCKASLYRSANGTCNNLPNPTWGAALRPFRRILLPKYADGVSEPRRASDGSDLPSAREVSLDVHRPRYGDDDNFTVMLAVWGQFVDHDITATAISRNRNGSGIKCCAMQNVHPECFPVLLGPFDPFYLRRNLTCMEFVRSAPAPTCTFEAREQLNQATSFLDGSVVYGNDDQVMSQLRTYNGGKLKMLKTSAGELLTVSEDLNDGCNRKEEFERGRYCFLSGDKRSNENLLLTSMHLLFARHHNSIAQRLSEVNPRWSDEKLFQETRKILSAEIQHITYNEFLPSVLPAELMGRLNISIKRSGYSDVYNDSVNPTIANAFASAAFRFGHTLLPGLLRYWEKNSTEYLELHKMLFNPFETFERGFLEKLVTGAMDTNTEKSDAYFTREVTQKLFEKDPERECGLDLVSLNIQRGRDHGLPSYPHWREVCGLGKPRHFGDLEGEIEEEILTKLRKLYKSVDDLDLYTGGLAEKPVAGSLVGPTITCLLADQFLRLKIGDRFWYERKEGIQSFKPEQLREIRKSSLAKVICATSGVTRAQPHVMRRIGNGNELKSCNEFIHPNFGAWRDA